MSRTGREGRSGQPQPAGALVDTGQGGPGANDQERKCAYERQPDEEDGVQSDDLGIWHGSRNPVAAQCITLGPGHTLDIVRAVSLSPVAAGVLGGQYLHRPGHPSAAAARGGQDCSESRRIPNNLLLTERRRVRLPGQHPVLGRALLRRAAAGRERG